MPGPHNEDDWACKECGYIKNFSNRIACFACGEDAPDRYVKRARAASEKWLTSRKDVKKDESQASAASPSQAAELAKLRKQLAAAAKELEQSRAGKGTEEKTVTVAEEEPDPAEATDEQKALCDELEEVIKAHEHSTREYFVGMVAEARKKLAVVRGELRAKQPPRKQLLRAEGVLDKATKAFAKATETADRLKKDNKELIKALRKEEAKADEEVAAKATALAAAEADMAEAIGRAKMGGSKAGATKPVEQTDDPDVFGQQFLEFVKSIPTFNKESIQLVAEAMGGFVAKVAAGAKDREMEVEENEGDEKDGGSKIMEVEKTPAGSGQADGSAGQAAAADEQYTVAVVEEAYSKLGRKGKLLEGKVWPRSKTFSAAEVHKDWTDSGWKGTVDQAAADLKNKKGRMQNSK